MCLDELENFIYAAEHNFSLRKELISCSNNKMIIETARKYGFQIVDEDLTEDSKANIANDWFAKSRINPIKPLFQR